MSLRLLLCFLYLEFAFRIFVNLNFSMFFEMFLKLRKLYQLYDNVGEKKRQILFG